MIPPALLRLRWRGSSGGWPTLWLPLFLLWPLLSIVLALAAIGVLLLAIAAQVSLARAGELFASAYRVLCALRGTRVDVVAARSEVFISVY